MSNDAIMKYHDYFNDIRTTEYIIRGEGYDDYLGRMMREFMGVSMPRVGTRLNRVYAQVNAGRWMWECMCCGGGVVIDMEKDVPSISLCPACNYYNWVEIILPDNWKGIEEELLRQPGNRLNTLFRFWEPDWGMDRLVARTAEATKQKNEDGIISPRRASFGMTRLWSVGEVLTASKKNMFERQNFRDIFGRNGPSGPYENAVLLWNATNGQRDGITAEDGALIFNSDSGRFEGYDGVWGSLANTEIVGDITITTQSSSRGTRVTSISHSLGRPPYVAFPFYIKVSGGVEAGYSIGDSISYGPPISEGENREEVQSMARAVYGSSEYYRWASLVGSDSNYIHISYVRENGSATHSFQLRQKVTTTTSDAGIAIGSWVGINRNNWRLRFSIVA